ncbi:MAG: hypothetical protein K2N38_04355, partial [Oscillospiraceae bacterium]|nr:hypothetical protein [Oscillospiraceae bacterium]
MRLKYIAPILLLFLSACSAKESRPAKDEFFVILEVNTPVKAAVLEYSLGGEPQGGQELTYARGGLFGEGERLC